MKQTVLTKNRLHVSNSHILILLLQYFLLSTFVYEIADCARNNYIIPHTCTA